MHLLLTDRLACPRCGPEFGLILLADRIEDRRVYEGALGCPNCRDRYPVEGGFGDLRAAPRPELPPVDSGDAAAATDPAETERLAALLGVTLGPGHVALVGPVARRAEELADLLGEIEVVAVDPEGRARAERDGVSRVACAPRLPFFSGTFRGVALSGAVDEALLVEAARVVGPTGRVVVLEAPPGARHRLEELGLGTLLDDANVVVARR